MVFLLVPLFFSVLLGCNSKDSEGIKSNADDISREGEYKNPVFQPVFADPSIVKSDDGYFYAYGTEDDWGKGNAHYVPVIRSVNLMDWEFVADAFNLKPAWKSPAFIWAPDVSLVDSKYYMYYSYSIWGDSNPGIGLAISDTPQGPFTDQGKLFLSHEVGVQNSIDPFYIENQGIKYLFWGSFHGIYGIKLSNDGRTTEGEKFQIAGDFMEAVYIYEKGGYFYLFGSTGTCCDGVNSSYKVIVGRSESLTGPYVNKEGNGFLDAWGSILLMENSNGGFAGPGHNAEIITDNEGSDWLLYHAVEKMNPYLPGGATKRPLMLDKVVWENGWPKIKNNQPGSGIQQGPVFN